MPKITINHEVVEVESNSTIFQACEKVGIEIPHFCYHKKLGVAGNCRMCLVEVEKNPKPVASCAMPVSEGMVIHTDTQKVKDMRESVMELLLINHPLDCPICDQGGECDLQEQAFRYGKGISKYEEEKRQVPKKYMGPLIETWMNRCIHCTRCVRFANDVAGIEEIGAINRGEDTEITTLEKNITSEISGNLIDVCPVGALTAKPIAYKYRNWELEKIESIDVHDAFGSNIYICVKNDKLVRILPRENLDINDEWISDKARFAFDGLKYQRLGSVYIRNSSGKLEVSNLVEAAKIISYKIKAANKDEIACIAGDLADMESMYAAKEFFSNIDVSCLDANIHGYNLNISNEDCFSRQKYLFNTSVNDINETNLCLIIGANIRNSAPVLNAFIGMQVRKKGLKVYRIGNKTEQTYKINDLGKNISILEEILSGKHEICSELERAKKPMIIIGDGVYGREDGLAILNLCEEIAKKYNFVTDEWSGFNVLHNNASTVGAIDLGFWAGKNNEGDFNIGDPVETNSRKKSSGTSDKNSDKYFDKNSEYTISPSTPSTKEILEMLEYGVIKVLYILEADNLDLTSIDFDKLRNINKNLIIVYHGTHGSEICNIADIIIPTPSYAEKSGSYTNMHGILQTTNKAVSAVGDSIEIWKFFSILSREMGIKEKWGSLELLRLSMNQYLEKRIAGYCKNGIARKYQEHFGGNHNGEGNENKDRNEENNDAGDYNKEYSSSGNLEENAFHNQEYNEIESVEYQKNSINSKESKGKNNDEELISGFRKNIRANQTLEISEISRDFYMTDIICRYSKTMIQCSKENSEQNDLSQKQNG